MGKLTRELWKHKGSVLLFLSKGSDLLLTIGELEPIDLTAYAFDQFSGEIGTLRFIRKKKKIGSFKLYAGRAKNLHFEKK